MFWLQFAVIIIALCFGARFGGIFMGMAGGVGLGVLVFFFNLMPSSPPIDVMLIIIAVVLAAATLQACGGMDYLVQIAEKLLRRNPAHITFMAPLVTYVFTFLSGTGNVAFSVIPVIAEVARESGVRPERPLSISIIASQQAITASPISAAMAALVALLATSGANGSAISMGTIMLIAVPATLCGIFAGAIYASRVGKELQDDPEFQRRLAAGLIQPPGMREVKEVTKSAKISVAMFLFGAVLIVLLGTIPELRPNFVKADGTVVKLAMTHTIEIVMLIVAAFMVITCRPNLDHIVSGSVFKSGMMGVVCIFGLAWMGDTLVSNQMAYIKDSIQGVVTAYPWLFAVGMMLVSALVLSQAATTRLLIPLGLALGLPPHVLIASWPACNGYFIIPSYATLIAGVAFDTTGTTKIGKFVFNHSYMIPGLITCFVSVTVGFLIGGVVL